MGGELIRQQMSDGWFQKVNDVPEKAISLSIKQIMESNSIICSVPDLRKAEVVRKKINGSISQEIPASIMSRTKAA